MLSSLPDFSSGRLLIVGDVMLDRYWHGSTNRISPEAPVPVVKVEVDEYRPGGAGNVAFNAAVLGSQTGLLALVGRDEAARRLSDKLISAGIDCHLLEAPDHPTITKLRIISRHQQLIRLDFEDSFSAEDAQPLLPRFAGLLDAAGAVVLSDYGKGTLSTAPTLIARAQHAGKPVVVDPKGKDFSRYRGATVITPNMSEFEAVVGHCADEATLRNRGETLRRELELTAVLITRSERGMTLLQQDQPALDLPTRARDVYDVTGAGDTVVAVLGAGLACGLTLADATALANAAAGIVVGKLGTAAAHPDELATALRAAPTAADQRD